MRVCVVPGDPSRRLPARVQRLADDGAPAGPEQEVADLPAAVARLEAQDDPRWVWEDSAVCYPPLLADGVTVGRCHDVELTEALLLGSAGRWGEPRDLAAAWSRLTGSPVGPPPAHPASTAVDGQDALFGAGPPPGTAPLPGGQDRLAALVAVHAAQLARLAGPGAAGLRLLVAAESAGALAAVEMASAGLPWDSQVHDALLTELLGPRPPAGGRPARLQELAGQVAAALDDPRLNPDSPIELLRALRRAGLPVRSTRRHELRGQEHPAIPPLLRYKELARLHVAHGWAWREQWVRDGRFHPEYVPGGVVSGRWATRGGGALQIPRAMRAAVVAPPGRLLIVADAGQLEPRVLAALSGDPGMVAATQEGDLYAAVAAQALGRAGARAEAKVALLAAMYGGGQGSPALAALRRRFPQALQLLEDAARAGEDGGLVRSALGRTCPPPEPGWLDGRPEDAAAARARARGRFTRNFVIQASAADWAAVLLAGLRTRLATQPGARLVFFQHDEVIVEAPRDQAEPAAAAVRAAAEDATRMVLGSTGVRVPCEPACVSSYAEKR